MAGHNIHWQSMMVAREENLVKRRVIEALTIHRVDRGKGTMNTDAGMQLSRLWLDVAV